MKRKGWIMGKIIATMSLLIIGLSLSAVCVAQAASPKPEGTLTISAVFMEFAPDPILTRNTAKPFMELIFDYLVGKTANAELSSDTGICNKWEVSPDVKTHTFFLRKGIKFHNGKELTAEDVKFSIERVIGPESVSGYAAPLRKYINKVNVVDPYKVVIQTKVPATDLKFYLSAVMGTEGCIVPKDYIVEKGKDNFVKAPIGTGPYRVKEIVMGDHMTLEAVKQHWRIGTPKYKTIVLRHAPEESTRIAQLKRREADIIEVSRERADEVKKAGFKIFNKPNATVLDMHFYEMWDKGSPLSDVRGRLALELAINKEEVAATLFKGLASPWPVGYVAPPDRSWDEKLFPFRPYDPEKAKKLIAEVGYTPKIKLYSYPRAGAPEIRPLAEAVAGYWEKIGVTTQIVPMDYGSFRKIWLKGAKTHKPAAGGGGFGGASIHAVATRFWHFGTDYKIFHSGATLDMLNSPEADKYMDAVQTEKNWEKSVELAKKWHRYKYDNVFTFAIVSIGALYGANEKVARWEFPVDEYAMGWDFLVSPK